MGKSSRDPSSWVSRWRLKLSEFEHEIVYKAENTNVNADALSQNPPETPVMTINVTTEGPSGQMVHGMIQNDIGAPEPLPGSTENDKASHSNLQEYRVEMRAIGGCIHIAMHQVDARLLRAIFYVNNVMVARSPLQTRTRARKLAIPNYNPTRKRAPNKPTAYFRFRREANIREPVQTDPFQSDPDVLTEEFVEEWPDNTYFGGDKNLQEEQLSGPREVIERQPEAVVETRNLLTTLEAEEGPEENHRTCSYGKNVVECREKLFMRKDNLLYFMTAQGVPCDRGAEQLNERRELPRLTGLNIMS